MGKEFSGKQRFDWRFGFVRGRVCELLGMEEGAYLETVMNSGLTWMDEIAGDFKRAWHGNGFVWGLWKQEWLNREEVFLSAVYGIYEMDGLPGVFGFQVGIAPVDMVVTREDLLKSWHEIHDPILIAKMTHVTANDLWICKRPVVL